MTKQSTVSIVIPTFNEERFLESTLKSVRNQTYKGECEIVVVDSMSTDRTAEIAKKYADKVITRKTTIAEAKNLGAEKSSGSVIVFLDADTLLDKNFVSRAMKHLKNPKVSMVVGTFASLESDIRSKLTAKLWCETCNAISMSGRLFHVGPATFAVKRDRFKIVKGYDKTYKVFEDVKFATEISKTGRVVLDRSLKNKTSMRKFNKYGHFKWGFYALKLCIMYLLFPRPLDARYPHIE